VRLLALHSMGHDTGVALFEGGRLLFTVETERVTRVRHDHRVSLALDHLWSATSFSPADIDFLVFSTNVRNSIAQIDGLESLHARIEGADLLEAHATSHMLGRALPSLVVAHEACHSAIALHAGGWNSPGLALINEGRGTFSRNSLFRYRGGRLELIDRDGLPWFGTGFGWSAIAYLLGFGQASSAAGTVMAMAAYGARSDEAEGVLRSVDPALAHSPRELQRAQAQPLFDYLSRHPHFAARASLVEALQRLFTDSVTSYCRRKLAEEACDHLALGGGCALNLGSNTALRELCPALAIPSNCNDAGQALGAALYALEFHFGIRPEPFDVYRCGAPLSVSPDILRDAGLSTDPFDPPALAAALAAGEVAAFAFGVSELGPRALGNRSLLGATARPGMRARLSERIKGRQWFRPLACVMRDETFDELFPGQPRSPHMLFQYCMPTGLAPEATHADGTCRIQTLSRSDHPSLWEVLREFERISGEAGLINTSLNGPGLPIAYRVEDVLDDLRGKIRLYVFDGVIARHATCAAIP
jgi:carbamoyltransferase